MVACFLITQFIQSPTDPRRTRQNISSTGSTMYDNHQYTFYHCIAITVYTKLCLEPNVLLTLKVLTLSAYYNRLYNLTNNVRGELGSSQTFHLGTLRL